VRRAAGLGAYNVATEAIEMRADDIVIEPDPVIEAYKRDIDRTLIRENLKLTVEQRCEQLLELQRFAIELQRSGREAFGRKY
jgi:hypothetical protein